MHRVIFLILITSLSVLRADQTYNIQTIAGTGDVGDNGPATEALLMQAEGIAIDGLGNIYIADAADSRIRKINAAGIIQTIAGTGSSGFSGDGGAAITAQLNHPYGIVLDLAGNIYVADLGNARVRKIDTKGIITTVAGGGSSTITAGKPAQAKDVQFMSPRNVAVDVLSNLYISDFDAQFVYQVTPAGALSILTGTGKSGLSGDNGAAASAQIAYPAGLATDANGDVFIADSGNNRLRRVWRGNITTVAINVPSPTGVSVDAAGHLYAASSSVASMQQASSPAGLTVKVLPAEDVVSDAGGTLYLASPHSVQKVVGGASIAIAGTSSSATSNDAGLATAAHLSGPTGVALSSTGDLYVAEQSGNRIRKISSSGITSIVASDSAGVKSPAGIAVDSSGTVYFTDTGNNRVRRISAGAVLTTVVDKLSSPSCLRIGTEGSLYVCDQGNDRVLKVTPAGKVSTAASVSKPAGVAIDKDGTLYVSSGSQIMQISASGASSDLVDGLSNPTGLAIDSSGSLIIVETGKNRIIELGPAGAIAVLAGTGQPGFGGDAGPAASAQLNNPQDVALDAGGNILIADAGNNRIRKMTVAATPIAAPITTPPLVTVGPVTVVNSASQQNTAIAPNEIVSFYGSNFDSAHTQVTFDGTPATVFYASAKQLNVLVPSSVKTNSSTVVSVLASGNLVGIATLPTVPFAPAIFTVSNGTGQAAALNEDGTPNSSSNPLTRGQIIVLFLTGDGINGNDTVTIGDYPADVLYAGPAPGFPGLSQINARVPGGFLPTGTQAVVVTAGGAATQPGVTIFVN